MPKHNKLLGKVGEDIAVQFLQNQGYQVINRNWRSKQGEIDIVATKSQILYCIEVKTRSNTNYGYPSEAINQKKLQRMKLTAFQFMLQNKLKTPCRLLVIEVIGTTCTLIEI